MRAVSIPAGAPAAGALHSKRVLALAGDERLVAQVRRGSEAAFEVAFERHAPPILSFCRHMLGSADEAEDAVQHTFAAAYRGLLRDEREIRLKPWLFTIARNRCLSLIRARREQPLGEQEIATAGLAEQVEHRADLRELLHDLRELPDEQRAALLLAEAGDLSHTEVAGVLGCGVARVKALVFRARSGLIERREARATPCEEIREQLATLRGGALRRSGLRHHLSACAGCRDYRQQVKRQRAMLAAALPVCPSLGLKSSVLGALGLGGGTAGGGGALVGASTASFGAATVAKVAAIGILAGGGAVAGERALDAPDPVSAGPVPAAIVPAGSAERALGAPGERSGRPATAGTKAAKRARAQARASAERDRAAKARGHATKAAKEPKRARDEQARDRSHSRSAKPPKPQSAPSGSFKPRAESPANELGLGVKLKTKRRSSAVPRPQQLQPAAD